MLPSCRAGALAIEVASGGRKDSLPGLDAFGREFESRKLLIGAQGLSLDTALSMPASELFGSA